MMALGLLSRPVVLTGLGGGDVGGSLETRCHGGGGSGHDLVVVDVEQPDPALLAHGERDEAGEFDQLLLAEVLVQARPELVLGVEAPRNRLGVGECGALAIGIDARRLEIH